MRRPKRRTFSRISGLRPLERLGLLVVGGHAGEDRIAELGDARVRAALERLLGQETEEPLDEVHPRRVGRREVELEPRIAEEPPLHDGRLVRREVIKDDMDVESGLDARIDLAQERDEVLAGAAAYSRR